MSIVDDYTLRNFIEETEAEHFRTASDTGANPNALMVWNLVREFAGLPELTTQDLRDKEPEVAKMHDLLEAYKFAKAQFVVRNVQFPDFGSWLLKELEEPEAPHSRACGHLKHEHGSACHSNCPTCGGRQKLSRKPTPAEREQERQWEQGWIDQGKES